MPIFDPAIFDPAVFDTGAVTPTPTVSGAPAPRKPVQRKGVITVYDYALAVLEVVRRRRQRGVYDA